MMHVITQLTACGHIHCVERNRLFVASVVSLTIGDVCKQTIMSDTWLNIGHEDDRLMPYNQPEHEIQNPLIGKLKLAASQISVNSL